MALRDALYASPDIWTDEIDELLQEISADVIEGWEVYERGYEGRPWQQSVASSEQHRKIARNYYPSQSVQFAYLPDEIEPTTWIQQTNEIYIRYDSGYDRDFNVDPDGDRQKRDNERAPGSWGKEPKYIVKGTFVNPIITRSPEKVATHIETEMERVASATVFNAEIERLSYHSYAEADEPPEDPTEYTEQSSPVFTVDGVGSTSVERLAKRFGTYYNVTLGEDRAISDCLSSWHSPGASRIVDAIEPVINRYNRFRSRDDWDGRDSPPDTWKEYPKEQPQ